MPHLALIRSRRDGKIRVARVPELHERSSRNVNTNSLPPNLGRNRHLHERLPYMDTSMNTPQQFQPDYAYDSRHRGPHSVHHQEILRMYFGPDHYRESAHRLASEQVFGPMVYCPYPYQSSEDILRPGMQFPYFDEKMQQAARREPRHNDFDTQRHANLEENYGIHRAARRQSHSSDEPYRESPDLRREAGRRSHSTNLKDVTYPEMRPEISRASRRATLGDDVDPRRTNRGESQDTRPNHTPAPRPSSFVDYLYEDQKLRERRISQNKNLGEIYTVPPVTRREIRDNENSPTRPTISHDPGHYSHREGAMKSPIVSRGHQNVSVNKESRTHPPVHRRHTCTGQNQEASLAIRHDHEACKAQPIRPVVVPDYRHAVSGRVQETQPTVRHEPRPHGYQSIQTAVDFVSGQRKGPVVPRVSRLNEPSKHQAASPVLRLKPEANGNRHEQTVIPHDPRDCDFETKVECLPKQSKTKEKQSSRRRVRFVSPCSEIRNPCQRQQEISDFLNTQGISQISTEANHKVASVARKAHTVSEKKIVPPKKGLSLSTVQSVVSLEPIAPPKSRPSFASPITIAMLCTMNSAAHYAVFTWTGENISGDLLACLCLVVWNCLIVYGALHYLYLVV